RDEGFMKKKETN
ncbi:unnamed protein product, partial [Oikopleura dioica]